MEGTEVAMGWVDRNREVERNRDVLERILALLISFAGLADRLRLLTIIGYGEAEAHSFCLMRRFTATAWILGSAPALRSGFARG